MRYGTLFSGIEGFGRGFDRAGMEPAFQCEIDRQALSVLRYRYPDVPKWTDVTEVDPDELPDVDVLAFGSPCQDLSVAGRREGLAGERSGLFVEAIRIADHLAPDWLVFENVPGMLSSQSGEDFAVVLEGLTGFRPAVPENGWRDAGVCLGPCRWCVWRVLDTQFFGPPQRRRRVFVVAGARGPCRPQILLEPESLPWNPPPSREAGQRPSGRVARSLRAQSQPSHRADSDTYVAHTPPSSVTSGGDNEIGPEPARQGSGPTKAARGTPSVAHTLRAEGHNASEDGTGRGTPLVAQPLTAREHKGPSSDCDSGNIVAFDTTQVTSKGNYSRPKPGDPCHPLAAGAHPPAMAFTERGRDGGRNLEYTEDVAYSLNSPGAGSRSTNERLVAHAAVPRRLTPTECSRLQGFPDSWNAWGIDENGERIELADSPRYRMLGNAVSVPVAHWIGKRLLRLARERGNRQYE